MSQKYAKAIHWYRRDLRVTDNTALEEARAAADEIIPVYLLSTWKKKHPWTGAKRQKFLCECLESLSGNLEHLGGTLIIRQGKQVKTLLQLVEETGAEAIFLNRDVDPFGKEIEEELENSSPVPVHRCHDLGMHAPGEVEKNDGGPYRVYTPFSKSWLPLEKRSPRGRPKSIKTPSGISSLPLPTLETWDLEEGDWDLPAGGEKAAKERMKDALKNRIENYEATRNFPALPGTSRLSQDLRWGTLSIRELYQKAASLDDSTVFLKELAWREFYFQILHFFPEVLKDEFNEKWLGLPWDEPDEKFTAWTEGKTGFPIVDAGIRELLRTGFMHNRVRMIVAMFLTKDLHVDWRLGEQFFAQHLIDGEIASNNGGWQWSAGTGADAAPYFRIQNPWTQSERYDKDGEYIKKWIPELQDVEAKRLHSAPPEGQSLVDDYPAPIVNHKDEREKTLGIFKRHKEQRD